MSSRLRAGVKSPVLDHLRRRASLVEKALDRFLPNDRSHPKGLIKAMRYSVFSGGKRVRPFLVLEAARVCGGSEAKAMPLACAVEMIHTYSLVHDDLPAMDDDDLRRGKATCHRKFGVATAILAGDALLTHAFQIIAEADGQKPERILRVINLVAEAVGPCGMVAGQALDLSYQKSTTSLAMMNRINRFKTAFLIAACLEGGALWGGGSKRDVRDLGRYGESIGFLFQVVDDIIDGEGYARVLNVKAAYKKAAFLREQAKRRLGRFGEKGGVLRDFADFLYQRSQ